MKSTRRAVRSLLFLAVCAILCVYISSGAHAQNAPANPADKSSASALMQQMVGTWSVRQRMWPGHDAEPVKLPPAIAQRHLIGGAFLEEIMELTPGSKEKPFTRTAYFNFNAVSDQYEYFSLDSRLPQMMNERSHQVSSQSGSYNKEGMTLYGGTFVAPQWGKAKNVAFTYRLMIGALKKDSQVVQLNLTPRSGKDTREFRAFEYTYTRQH